MFDEELKLEIKKGFNYYCSECNETFRYNKLIKKEEPGGMFFWLTCPKCGETIVDLKRK